MLFKKKKPIYQCENKYCRHVQDHPDRCDLCRSWVWNVLEIRNPEKLNAFC